ncbi:sugar phosphate isomerase/epimerase family protein [Dorea sp. D27]|uniref:sugar phosphate isomerase/epimerase family protein n=1 Tax=Dorea sp. D27 TaxID=658665 RepID=UPI000673A774|nr:sugar phosphate isomerase/epimerase [Dorea sp. D27]KMZ54445.1 AP endonuclease, family 2 [Dorea sp. D27]
MKTGIFAKIWAGRDSLETVFRTARTYGIESFQFNMCLAGGKTLPDRYDVRTVGEISYLADRYGIGLAAMSGTFNLMEKHKIEEYLEKSEILLEICTELSIPVLSICTGTNSREGMWTWHPDNDSQESWNEMKEHLGRLLSIAEKYPVSLGVEPEVSNIVSSAAKARRLLDEYRHPSIRIIMDAANLFRPGEKALMNDKIREAVALLKDEIVLVHAKDCKTNGQIIYKAAGKGDIDFKYYISCLREAGYTGSVVLHGLAESEAKDSILFLKKQILQ